MFVYIFYCFQFPPAYINDKCHGEDKKKVCEYPFKDTDTNYKTPSIVEPKLSQHESESELHKNVVSASQDGFSDLPPFRSFTYMDVDVGVDSGIEVSPLKRKNQSESSTPVKVTKAKKGTRKLQRIEQQSCGCSSKSSQFIFIIVVYTFKFNSRNPSCQMGTNRLPRRN